jgi:ubiquinone/menaquinone biosynthesis C-methylase UbiE
MQRRLRQWIVVGLLAVAAVVVVTVASLPYLPLIHGTTADEVERLAAWLDIQPGTRVADLGAGDGTFTVSLARRVGPSGHVYATEIDAERLADIRQAVTEAKLSNVTVIEGAVSRTNLPEACCDALFSRMVYHHLMDPAAINADIVRALRPGGRLVVIDFEPGGIMDWIGRPETADRHGGHGTPKETILKEVPAAGFQLIRGPETWRGRTYAVLFRRPGSEATGSSIQQAPREPAALR